MLVSNCFQVTSSSTGHFWRWRKASVIHRQTYEYSAQQTNEQNLNPAPPPLTSQYTYIQTSDFKVERNKKYKQRGRYQTNQSLCQGTICSSIQSKRRLPGRWKTSQEDWVDGLPLNEQGSKVWTERLPAEGDQPSQAVAGSECLVYHSIYGDRSIHQPSGPV